jgi:hypothetical protein
MDCILGLCGFCSFSAWKQTAEFPSWCLVPCAVGEPHPNLWNRAGTRNETARGLLRASMVGILPSDTTEGVQEPITTRYTVEIYSSSCSSSEQGSFEVTGTRCLRKSSKPHGCPTASSLTSVGFSEALHLRSEIPSKWRLAQQGREVCLCPCLMVLWCHGWLSLQINSILCSSRSVKIVLRSSSRAHANTRQIACFRPTSRFIPRTRLGSLAGVLVESGNSYRHSSRSPSNNNTIDGTQRRQQIS